MKLSEHEIVSKATALFKDLGKVPTVREAVDFGISQRQINQHGGWQKILLLAGVIEDTKDIRHQRKLTGKEIAEKLYGYDIEKQVSLYETRITRSKFSVKDLMAIAGDTHFPFIHKPTQKLFLEFNKKEKPKYIIQMGDLFDMYSYSKFPRSHNIYKPQEEIELARGMAEEFFATLRKDNPKAKMFNLLGNHDVRPIKRVMEGLPEFEHIAKDYLKKIATFNGVTLVEDYRDILKIQGIGFHHGYLNALGQHRDKNLMSMVVGHTHRGGVSYRRFGGDTFFELNAGLMGDPNSKGLSYTDTKIQEFTLGFGVIDQLGPRFIHY
jgi:predicted phosphodiesterase